MYDLAKAKSAKGLDERSLLNEIIEKLNIKVILKNQIEY